MMEGFSFPTLYSRKDVETIRQNPTPAKALLEDLTGREVTVEELTQALRKIGNKRAVSIIQEGSQVSCLIYLILFY